MTVGICLLLYGGALVWAGPRLLTSVTRGGLAPRLSIAAWLVAIAMAIGAWVVVGVGVAWDVATGRPGAAPVEYCVQLLATLADAGPLGRATVLALGAAAVVASAVVVRRIILLLRRFGASGRDHARAARILGTSRGGGVFVVPAERPAAYCVAGRPAAIVLTTGALAALSGPTLAAVIAHERAHLTGRHLHLMTLLRALAAAMPRLPLFRAAVDSVSRLVEMSADDEAAGQHGRSAVLSGLVALAGQPRAPGGSLAAADTAALARAVRLVGPLPRGPRIRERVRLIATMATIVAAPLVVTAFCHV